MAPPARCKIKTKYLFRIGNSFRLHAYTSNNNLRYHAAVRNLSDIPTYILYFIAFFDHFSTVKTKPVKKADLRILQSLEKKVLWLSMWMIHNANHLRQSVDGLKVGGHQASSASITTIMTALYFNVLKVQDRVAVKPHASPVFHAIQYMLSLIHI